MMKWFTVTFHRRGSEKISVRILELIRQNPELSAKAIGLQLGISQRAVEKQLAKLKAEGKIIRDGSDKGGSWRIIE